MLAAAGAQAATVVPGTPRSSSSLSRQSCPISAFALGTPLVVSAVAGCVLLAAIFLLRAPVGTGLRRRIAPHVGKGERKSTRGPSEERFATASSLMRATESAFGHLRVWHWLHRLLERADIPLRTVELAYIAIGSALGSGLLLALFGASSLVTLLVMVAGGSVPIMFVAWKARRRLVAIDNQLPDLLITLAASLKAGHSFRQGIQAVVDEGEGPAGKEFKRVLTETRLGRPMDDALGEMAERVGSKNLRFVVTAVTIQRQVGGSLAGIFDMVAEAVRQRQAFAAQDPFAHGDGPDVGLRPRRHPTLPARRHHAPEQGVHVTDLHHLDGAHAVVHRRADDGLRQPDPPQNRLLQRLMPDVMLLALAVFVLAAAAYLVAEVVTQPAREHLRSIRRAATYGRLRQSGPGSSACTSALACSIPRSSRLPGSCCVSTRG